MIGNFFLVLSTYPIQITTCMMMMMMKDVRGITNEGQTTSHLQSPEVKTDQLPKTPPVRPGLTQSPFWILSPLRMRGSGELKGVPDARC